MHAAHSMHSLTDPCTPNCCPTATHPILWLNLFQGSRSPMGQPGSPLLGLRTNSHVMGQSLLPMAGETMVPLFGSPMSPIGMRRGVREPYNKGWLGAVGENFLTWGVGVVCRNSNMRFSLDC